MDILRTAAGMQRTALAWRAAGLRIGLVPTMGYLHAGHLTLLRALRAPPRPPVDRLVVSIYVNPIQFGPREDLARYPRDFERDEALCRAEGADAVFYPSDAEMYAPDASVRVTEDHLTRPLCSASRPGHFTGVCTVVAKLFNLVLPHAAAFGEKDAQQLRVIRRMIRDLNFPVELVAVPTVREPDGLALSSRNVFLSPEDRAQAVVLHEALDTAARAAAEGERCVAALRAILLDTLARAPRARTDYAEILDDDTLEPIERLDRPALAALAVFFGSTRLIDNTVLRPVGGRAGG